MDRHLTLATLVVILAAACATGPSADPLPLTAAIVGSFDPGVVPVATTVPAPLRIVVRQGGQPRAGVSVTWGTSSGTVSPATGITDAEGIASAQWTLGNTASWPPGTAVAGGEAWATVAGTSDLPRFGVTVVPGPAASITKAWGDAQVVGAAAVFGFVPLVVKASDRFGNPAPSAQFEWRVVTGPVVFDAPPMPQGTLGESVATLRGTGQPGTAQVEVGLTGTSVVEVFSLEVVAGEWAVALYNPSYTTVGFRSHQNRSTPAVDTLPIGGTMVWKFQDGWDVVSGALQLVWTGAQGFPNCPVHGEPEVFCRVTFSAPGMYSYTLSGPPFATGTITVR